jgi:hypothetical protein
MIRERKMPITEQVRKALDETAGEPLSGSGFESETPDPDFRADNNDSELTAPV